MSKTTSKHSLPSTGFIRLPNIIGNPKSNPPITPLIPVSSSSWWNGIKKGIYPKPFKIGPNTTAWKAEDIRELIDHLGGER
jgi:prophage regulatory protein